MRGPQCSLQRLSVKGEFMRIIMQSIIVRTKCHSAFLLHYNHSRFCPWKRNYFRGSLEALCDEEVWCEVRSVCGSECSLFNIWTCILHLMFSYKNWSLLKRKESWKFTRNPKMRRKMIIKTIFKWKLTILYFIVSI